MGSALEGVSLNLEKEWPNHHHSGYEQMMYVVSGRGIHRVNGEIRELSPGIVEYIPVGALHYVRNTGHEPLVHLSVYHPIMPKEIKRSCAFHRRWTRRSQPHWDQCLPISCLHRLCRLSHDKFAEAVGLGVIIVDVSGKLVTRPTRLPEFCMYLRSQSKCEPECPAFDPASGAKASGEGHL